MLNLTINGQAVCAQDGATIFSAARENHIHIPSLCHIPGIHDYGACRICVVEVEGAKNLPASCLTPAREGMVVRTNTERVRNARRVLYELMLSDHSQDCNSCARNQSCEFQALGKQLGVEDARFAGEHSAWHVDASPSVTRDTSKCILCRRCVTACGTLQTAGVLSAQGRGFNTEISPAMGLAMGSVNCTFCGQCTVVCPVGALKETNASDRVWAAIDDPKKHVVAQVAPAVRVALGEAFGLAPGTRVTGKIAAALRRLGFDDVFDTNFSADLTILEEGGELLERLEHALMGEEASLPMITSCSPGWIKYAEHQFPDTLAHLSTCKSPHMMLGALVKSYYAEKIGVPPEDLYVVSVMPCTAKKFEIVREEMSNGGLPNVDAVVTTREFAEMIKTAGIDLNHLEDEEFDNPLGMSSGAADIFGLTGGVMEAALRTVYELVTGRELPFAGLHVTPIAGFAQVKEAAVTIEDPLPKYGILDGIELRVAVTSGFEGARKLMEDVAAGTSPYHFIEVMGCPGGCIMGGGQPRGEGSDLRERRLAGLYSEDEAKTLRKSHDNPYVQALYTEFLGTPGGHKSHELLHTHYVKRGSFNELSRETYVLPTKPERTKAAPPTGKAGAFGRREEIEPPHLLELESESRRLKAELDDALDTVEILKGVIDDMSRQ